MRKCSGTGVEFEGYRASVLAVAKAKSPSPALTQDLSLPSGLYSRVPNLGLVLFLLKNIAAYFFHQSQTSSGKAAVPGAATP